MFGLTDQVGRQVSRVRGHVGDHHDLARTGDAIDIHGPIDVTLGQGYEEISRADDLVDRLEPDRIDTVSQCGDPLAPPIR